MAEKLPLERLFASYTRGEIHGEVQTCLRTIARTRELARAFLEAEQGERAIGCEQAARMLEDEMRRRYPESLIARGGHVPGGRGQDPEPRTNSRADLGY